MLLLGFYFMLRPGEYAHTKSKESTPFRLKHVHLFAGHRRLNHLSGPTYPLAAATSVALEFDCKRTGCEENSLPYPVQATPPFAPW
jgi:hypothetical protein